MTDERFFKNNGPYSLQELAKLCDGELICKNEKELLLKGVAPLSHAKEGDITFYHNPKYKKELAETKASACLIHPAHKDQAPKNLTLIVTPKPYRSYAKIAKHFYPPLQIERIISPLANISSTAKVGKNVMIGPFSIIEDDVEIGENSTIGAYSLIGKGVSIGQNCQIESHTTITHTIVGNNVLIKTGARIGQKGFGFEMDASGPIDIPQLGRVLIGDFVEIGANTAIDRGAGPDTIIGKGCRIDNLVQIAHNVVLGDNCVIVAQVGIAGSTKLGNFVIVAGQAGLAGHLVVGDGAKIAAQSGVMRNISPTETVAGSPSIPVRDWHKQTIALARLINPKERK